ncbi:MAG: T9SS type A sorting domain-containing protein, partial [Flavobacteriales bacterium]|nr:T9SS type A sorting domain-containing protein [Flavobacteriales bacterium]
SGGTLNWTESIKTQNGDAFERGLFVLPQVGLKLTGESSADFTYVVLDDEMSGVYDTTRDAFHLGGNNSWDADPEDAPVGISTRTSDDYEVSVNNLSWEAAVSTIPVHLSVLSPQTITISTIAYDEMPESACITLEDLETGEFHFVDEEMEFTIELTEAYVGQRFLLHFATPMSVDALDQSCINSEDGSATVQAYGTGEMTYNWYDEMGQLILTETTAGPSTIDGLPLGNYTVEVEGSGALCGTVAETFYIDQPAPMSVTSEFEADFCVSGQGWIEVYPSGEWNYSYDLLDQNGELYLSESDVFGVSMIEALPGQEYTVLVHTGCETLELAIDLSDEFAVVAEIEADATDLDLVDGSASVMVEAITENAGSTSWYVNGEWYSNVAQVELVFDAEGTYIVTLDASNDVCAVEDTIEITVSSADAIQDPTVGSVSIIVMEDGIQMDLSSYSTTTQIDIYNSLGQLVISKQTQGGQPQAWISTVGLSTGAYTLRLTDGDDVSVVQFVK